MKDFENKIIKLYLNSDSGNFMQTGLFISMEDDFVVIKNTFTNNIQYYSKYFIKYIEIVKSIDEGSVYNG